MINRMIRIPKDIISEDILEETDKVVAAYLLNNNNRVLVVYKNHKTKEIPLKTEIEKLKEYANELHSLVNVLFQKDICDSNTILNKIQNSEINQNHSNESAAILSEIRTCIDHITIHISAMIYRELQKYINENVVEEYIMSSGLHSLRDFAKKPLYSIYKILKNFEENELVSRYNRKQKS